MVRHFDLPTGEAALTEFIKRVDEVTPETTVLDWQIIRRLSLRIPMGFIPTVDVQPEVQRLSEVIGFLRVSYRPYQENAETGRWDGEVRSAAVALFAAASRAPNPDRPA